MAAGFFERHRADLTERGLQPGRLAPGQFHTDEFPVLSVEPTPSIDRVGWSLRVHGCVEAPMSFDFDALCDLGLVDLEVDIHCVTKWSKLGMRWTGVQLGSVLRTVGVQPEAACVLQHAESGYSANVPLEVASAPDSLLAIAYDGTPLLPEHGFPVRTLLPRRYFWKSVKWVVELEVLSHDSPGFWERLGYHNDGDPWLEQRAAE